MPRPPEGRPVKKGNQRGCHLVRQVILRAYLKKWCTGVASRRACSRATGRLESFKEYIQKGRKQKPGNQLLSADDTPKELTLKARQKLDKQIAESIAGENIKRHKLFWPEEAQLVNYCKWTKIQRGDQELHVATCQCCEKQWTNPRANNILHHFQSAAHWLCQQGKRSVNASAVAPSGVLRSTKLADSQHLLRIKSAYFALKTPTVSLQAGSAVPEVAQTMFEDLGNMFTEVSKQLRAQSVTLPAFAKLASEYSTLMSTAHDSMVQADYFLILAEYFHEERLESMRTAITTIALYMDESTDISSTAHMLLCGTFFDKDLNFRDELIEIFDVSEEGATVGTALEDRVDKVLGATG